MLLSVVHLEVCQVGLGVAELGDADAVEGPGGVLLPGEGGNVDASALAVLGEMQLRLPGLGLACTCSA